MLLLNKKIYGMFKNLVVRNFKWHVKSSGREKGVCTWFVQISDNDKNTENLQIWVFYHCPSDYISLPHKPSHYLLLTPNL